MTKITLLVLVETKMAPTQQRQTADALVAAFNRMDVSAIVSLRGPSCMREIYPRSLGIGPSDNASFEMHLHKMARIFHNFNLTCLDLVEDVEARKITMHLNARADTKAGEYENEYMWTLHFDETGEKITNQKEFVDSVVNKEFWPKLAASLAQESS